MIDYKKVKNSIRFFEEWIKDLKKELNDQYKIILIDLIPLFSYKLNRDIRIIFFIFNNTHKIIIWR